MKTIMIKLVTGDVVLGRADEADLLKEEITIEKPMQLMLDPTAGGVGMIPYDAIFTQSEPDSQTFETIHIVHQMEVHPSFEEAYIKQTTGIELTSTPAIEVA